MSFVVDYEPAIVEKVIPLIPEYGRFDDMWTLLDDEKLRPVVIEYVKKQLESDIHNCNENKPISLLAKWLPSCNASSASSKKYSKIIRQHLNMTESAYRKTLSWLRKYIDVVEIKMSAKQWGDIKYETVPSRANLIYNDAFLRNDEERRREFLAQLEKGETKINAGTLFPHDLPASSKISTLGHSEISNTNIEAVFDLILSTAIRNNMSQKDIPANILIVSDMEFDGAVCCNGSTFGGVNANLFKVIETKYRNAGYKLPRLVFWNVNSRTNTIPVRENEMGVALVSGFSVNICKMVMSGKTDPFECLLETLNSERYKPVEIALTA